MDHQSMISAIDAEIATLKQARTLLSSTDNSGSTRGTRAAAMRKAAKRVTRRLSPEARKRIAEAQRKRWAAAKKQKKSTARRAIQGKGTKSVQKKSVRPAKAAKKTTPTANPEAAATA